MRILKKITRTKFTHEVREQNTSSDYWDFYYNDNPLFVGLTLVKENNRGWTFVNYTMTGNRTTFFFSRGDFEIVEE